MDRTATPKIGRRLAANAALLTPFTHSGEVDWARLAAHARGLLGGGLSAVGAFGTTGEGASISATERAPLYERMAAGGVGPDRIIDCSWGTAADDVARQVVRATEAGCAAILLPPLGEHRDLIILVGDERHLPRAVRRGATGAVSGVANIAAELVIDIVDGKDHPRLSAMVDTICSHPIVPALKHLLAARTGAPAWSRLRPPLLPLTANAGDRLSSGVNEAFAGRELVETGLK